MGYMGMDSHTAAAMMAQRPGESPYDYPYPHAAAAYGQYGHLWKLEISLVEQLMSISVPENRQTLSDIENKERFKE